MKNFFITALSFLISISLTSCSNQKHEANPKTWALATAALFTEAYQETHQDLTGVEKTPANVSDYKEALQNAWDIKDRESMLSTLEWLETEGHHAAFLQMKTDFEAIASQNPILKNHQAFIDTETSRWGNKGILAFDGVRYIFLCRKAYLLDYLSEAEAWQKIMSMARKMQKTFSSWEEMAENFITGGQFWHYSIKNPGNYRLRFEKELKFLLESQDSPWKQIPWDLPLEGA